MPHWLQGACQALRALLRRARAQKDELDRAWWREAAEQGDGPAGGGPAGAPADEAGLDTWQARRAHVTGTGCVGVTFVCHALLWPAHPQRRLACLLYHQLCGTRCAPSRLKAHMGLTLPATRRPSWRPGARARRSASRCAAGCGRWTWRRGAWRAHTGPSRRTACRGARGSSRRAPTGCPSRSALLLQSHTPGGPVPWHGSSRGLSPGCKTHACLAP